MEINGLRYRDTNYYNLVTKLKNDQKSLILLYCIKKRSVDVLSHYFKLTLINNVNYIDEIIIFSLKREMLLWPYDTLSL